MRDLRIVALAFTVFLGAAGTAAALEPKPYEAPPSLTAQDLEALKAKSKSNMVGFGKDVSVETAPFPWPATILGLIVIAVMIPIGWSAYKSAAKEFSASGPNAPRPPSRSLDE